MSECCECDCGNSVLGIGSEVPDFSIDTFDPATGDFGTFDFGAAKAAKKWTILVFYPGDFTFVCSTELNVLGEMHARFKGMGAEVVSVSTDTKFVHLAWHRHEAGLKSVTYPMAADPTGALARLFGVYNEEGGYARRGTFIISPEGKVVVIEVHDDPMGRNMEELMRRFKMCLLIQKDPRKACPSKWKDEGDATLEPGAKLVGKVYGDGGALKDGQ